MENKSYVEDTGDTDEEEELKEEQEAEQLSEEERQRRIQMYKEMIQSLETPVNILSPSSSKVPLNPTEDSPSHSGAGPLPEKTQLEFDKNSVLLLNSFLVDKKRHRVFLSNGMLIWEREKGNVDSILQDGKGAKGDSKSRTLISVDNIIAVKVPPPRHRQNHPATSTDYENIEKFEASSFTLHFARRRTSDLNKWKTANTTFCNSDPRIIRAWVQSIQEILNSKLVSMEFFCIHLKWSTNAISTLEACRTR